MFFRFLAGGYVKFLAGFPIAERLRGGEFASAELDVFNPFLDGEFEGFEVGAVVAAVAEGLLEALSAAAPPVYFVVDGGVFYCDGAGYWRYRLEGFFIWFASVVLLDVPVKFKVKM